MAEAHCRPQSDAEFRGGPEKRWQRWHIEDIQLVSVADVLSVTELSTARQERL
ncbi:hypothetical protein PP568_25345 [Mycobacteroides abscessus]|jgi:hypothetical protein|uniref:Uncharacterized protein n=1 Tax=Mycobacteroides abscessus subsp. abscessus TaxID=1185650 RepID=A0AB38D894_9MYCO|nr:hypothetical protein [Mycobacteroides abscessus]MDY6996598.1 hypothetical protein [Actinomycetota bacterium]MBN7297540.1 hypothetical protein [Mycobacteroides abscessus subsp. abscessus]MBN7459462.1 hypothetical protein [Mycobacteroides abscessus subsp. abscessus]MBN7557581.1 hypothetical protein [Mycobacteroides abscessus subsp. abscessus]MDM2407608.1 hypothetical protein [Mycobacteroides abscessus]